MALVLTQANLLLEELMLSVLITKNALRPTDRHQLNTVDTDDLYNNIIHYVMEDALCAYLAKERNKALRREYGIEEINKNLL